MKSAVMNSRIARRNKGNLFASALGGLACNIATRAKCRAQESRFMPARGHGRVEHGETCRDHLGNAGYHGPSGDKKEQGEGSDARPEESQNADNDARHAHEDEPTPALTLPCSECHDEIERAIGQRPSPKEYHQGEETEARRNE